MKKFDFSLGDGPELQEGLNELQRQGYFVRGGGDKDVRLAHLVGKHGYSLTKVGNKVRLAYSTPSDFYYALSLLIANYDEEIYDSDRESSFKGVYALCDCSRNAVRTVEQLKKYITTLVLSGYKGMYLYIEDTYKIENEKYFGYQRGGYTKEELKEIVEYAKKFCFEVIPAIQTLAHLKTMLRWDTYYEIADTEDILLVGENRTYELIDHMLATLSEVFETNKINLGMDEAHFIGLGGYLNKHGYKDRKELMLEHIRKVLPLCKKYNFTDVRIWSDMLIKKYDENDQDCTPLYNRIMEGIEGITLTPVFWDYYETEYDFYDRVIKAHKKVGDKTVFTCGGGYTWFGYAPLNKFAQSINSEAVKCAKANNVDELVVANWYDGGAEGSLFSGLATLINCATFNYSDGLDEKMTDDISLSATGYLFKELNCFDYPNLTFDIEKRNDITSSSKYLLYGDILYGTFEKNINSKFPTYYERAITKLSPLSNDKRSLNYAFDTMLKLSVFLKAKVEIQLVLRKAYKCADRGKLVEISNDFKDLIIKAKDFYSAVILQWERENKAFGEEVIDVKLGGVILRLEHAKTKLDEYLSGKTQKIPELEEDVLPYMTIANYSFVPGDEDKCNMVAFCYPELTSGGIF